MYVYYCRTYEKAVSGGGEREKGGHATVVKDASETSRYCRSLLGILPVSATVSTVTAA